MPRGPGCCGLTRRGVRGRTGTARGSGRLRMTARPQPAVANFFTSAQREDTTAVGILGKLRWEQSAPGCSMPSLWVPGKRVRFIREAEGSPMGGQGTRQKKELMQLRLSWTRSCKCGVDRSGHLPHLPQDLCTCFSTTCRSLPILGASVAALLCDWACLDVTSSERLLSSPLSPSLEHLLDGPVHTGLHLS